MGQATNPSLKDLEILVGEWKVELAFPVDPPGKAVVSAKFEWIEDGAYLMIRMGDRTAGLPYSMSVVGRDDSTENYTILYFDNRGVSRVYQMGFSGGEWKQWRNAPGFSQRFTGRLSDDANTITARWEKSTDEATWEHDFNLTYRRVT